MLRAWTLKYSLGITRTVTRTDYLNTLRWKCSLRTRNITPEDNIKNQTKFLLFCLYRRIEGAVYPYFYTMIYARKPSFFVPLSQHSPCEVHLYTKERSFIDSTKNFCYALSQKVLSTRRSSIRCPGAFSGPEDFQRIIDKHNLSTNVHEEGKTTYGCYE